MARRLEKKYSAKICKFALKTLIGGSPAKQFLLYDGLDVWSVNPHNWCVVPSLALERETGWASCRFTYNLVTLLAKSSHVPVSTNTCFQSNTPLSALLGQDNTWKPDQAGCATLGLCSRDKRDFKP